MSRILDAARHLARRSGGGGWLLAVVLGLWLVLAWPIATGERTFVLRDVLTTHLPLKSFGAAELAAGRIPAFDPHRAGGQPFRGDPNALPFYPGNVLYLVLPFWSAFGLHYAGHWLVAFFGMRRLGGALGQSEEAALMAALAYAGSGYLLTGLTFMNLLTVAAWAPWSLAGLARGDRRGTLAAGAAAGMMLLGGEPLSAAMVVPLMAMAAGTNASSRAERWRGLGRAAIAGGLALALALPQIVATARVLPWSYRGAHGLEPARVVAGALHPARLLELVWPTPWGWPSDLGRSGFWAPAVTDGTPYVYTLHFGLVAFVLALGAARTRRGWTAFAATALAAAWALGLDAGWTVSLTGGWFRYPQKLALPFTLAAAVLSGFGLDRIRALRRPVTPWIIAAALSIAAAAALLFAGDRWTRWSQARLAREQSWAIAKWQSGQWLALAVAAGLLAVAAGWAARRRSAATLCALQLVGLAQLWPLWVTDETSHYREPAPLRAAIGDPARIAQVMAADPPWEASGLESQGSYDPVDRLRLARLDLWPDFAPLDGLEQVLAPDLDGLTSPLTVFAHRQLAAESWPRRLEVLRRLGAGWIVRAAGSPGPPLAPVAVERRPGGATELYRVPRASPLVSWPNSVVTAPSPVAAWVLLARRGIDEGTAVASRSLDHRPGGTVAVAVERSDRLELDVDSPGGLVVVRRTYWPLWRARTAEGERLSTQPVDLALLGVEVPAGRRRVILDVSAWPEAIAVAVALVAWIAVGVAWRRG